MSLAARDEKKTSAAAVDCSVVIVTWNRPELLRSCLVRLQRSVSESGLVCEIWVVDNGSTAGDADLVAAEFPSVKLIRSPANVGFARANNLALRRATGRYCLLVNNDVLVPPDALRGLAEFMDSRPEVGVAGASLVDANGNRQRSYGTTLTLAEALADELHLTTLLRRLPALPAPGADSADAGPDWREVGYVSGAFFAIRREVLDAVGLLDERFDFYSEEMDWCVRARAEGWKVATLKRVSAVHHHGATARSKAELFHAVRLESRRRFLEKYHGPLASLAYRAAAGIGALALMLRSAFPGGGRSRSQRFRTAVSALSWAFRGRQPWPPASD